jgi:hypothetical protein
MPFKAKVRVARSRPTGSASANVEDFEKTLRIDSTGREYYGVAGLLPSFPLGLCENDEHRAYEWWRCSIPVRIYLDGNGAGVDDIDENGG